MRLKDYIPVNRKRTLSQNLYLFEYYLFFKFSENLYIEISLKRQFTSEH